MSSNGDEKQSTESDDKVTDKKVAMRTASKEQHDLRKTDNSEEEPRVTRRCFPIPTEILPGAEAVRGPEYNEEDEEGTVIIGERSEVIESDEIVTAHLVNVDADEDLRSQVGSLQEQLRRIETVRGISFTVKTKDQPPNSLLPESPPLYGREEELQKLGEALGLGGRMAALVGGAGMGKTHCASHFAQNWLQEDAAHRFVLWLESDTENVIRVSYLKALETMFGREVPDSEEEMSIRDLARLVWQALGEESTQCEWLVVYNNVPEVLGESEGAEAFSPLFFPTPLEDWGRGRILLTTRCASYGGRIRSLGNHHVTKVPVEPLDVSTAVALLTDSLDNTSVSDSERGDANEVAMLFGYMPLAIVTANSQMVDAFLTVSEYLDDLKAGLTESDVQDAVSLAVANALSYARGHGLGDVLEVAAFLNPDQLTLELLGCDRKTARRLCKLSLLRHSGDDVYTMHRLHQEAAREGVSPLEAITSAKQALTRFDANNSDTWKFGIAMVPHLLALEKNVETLEKHESTGLELLGKAEYTQLLALRAQILHYALHKYEEARTQYEKSISMNRDVHGSDAANIDLAKTLGCLGALERKLGNFDKARLHWESSLAMKRRVYGPNAENADLAETLDGHGHLEKRLGNYEEARSHFEQSLEMKRHVYGPDAKNADLAATLSHLGDLERKQRNFEEARSHFEHAFEMQRHVYGSDAKNTELAMTLGSLGILEMKLRNHEKAHRHFEQSLEMKRHVYGPDAKNTDLAFPLGSLGDLKLKLGEYEEARLHYEEALDMKRHVYGPEAKNTDLAFALNSLGMLEKKLGNHEKARRHFEQAFEMQRQVYGPDAKNNDLAFTLGSLGNLEMKLGNYDEARPRLEQAFDMKRHVYGVETQNVDLARTLDILGKLEQELGNYEKARMHYEAALEMERHVYGPEAKNSYLERTLKSLGNIEKKLGNDEEAQSHLEQARLMRRHVYGSKAKTNDSEV